MLFATMNLTSLGGCLAHLSHLRQGFGFADEFSETQISQ